MKEKKGLYPDKSVYTQQIGPGFCFGALALMLRFFFEVPVCTLELTLQGVKGITKIGDLPPLHVGLPPALDKTQLRCGSPGLAAGMRIPPCLPPSQPLAH